MRFWEIDCLRGMAVVFMLIFHLLVDLAFLKGYRYGFDLVPWQAFIASLFLILNGVSLTLSRNSSQMDYPKFIKKSLGRCIVLLFLGGLISLITGILLPGWTVTFGILHLIALSLILTLPLLNLRLSNIGLGLLIIAAGMYLRHFRFSSPWLLWVGLIPVNYQSVDYFPLLPWFGVISLGIGMGNLLYHDRKRNFPLRDFTHLPLIRHLCLLGRNSLTIYLLHQPVLLALIYLLPD